MAAAEPLPHRRCATYTRKSSEEGLEQDFNSLHAQREACEAYIRSQAGEGWKPVPTEYDDGGFSGGTLERPGLARLLADIQARKVDTVVVYKVDRLTRSLADFAQIVEIFDAHGVSFVSVTQQFNTTTSMGRLTLNMLLSFAQFEREVTGERIRDKIAASKRKGMWMGGPVPLGYEPQGRTLVVQEQEARAVRALFRLYLELGSVRRVKEEADRLGLVSKRRPGCKTLRGGRPLSRGTLYNLLGNPLYAGRVRHEGKTYEGQHPAIVDAETWEAVQAKLAAQAQRKGPSQRRGSASPLRGKLFDENGGVLTPTHAVKAGRRYRYYVSKGHGARARKGASRGRASQAHHAWRLPAREIEPLAQDAVTALLGDQADLAGRAREVGVEARRLPDFLGAVDGWAGAPWELVQRVELRPEEVTLQLDLSRFLDGEALEIRYGVPVQIKRRGVETRFVVEGSASRGASPRPDLTLVHAVVRAHRWFEELASGRVSSLQEIARVEGVSASHVGHLITLAFLAPEIIAAIVEGTQPVDLTADELIKRTELPLDWSEQRSVLGFD